jgi:acyl carrier protein
MELGTGMNDDRATVAAKVKQLLVTGLRIDMRPEEINESVPIFGEGGLGLDSIDALELVVLIEEAFGISVPDEEIGREAFASVAVLTDYVRAERAKL